MSFPSIPTPPGIIVLENGRYGGTIAGPPAVLSEICRRMGFRNDCRRGRVGLTAPKMAAIGLADAVGVDADWRSRSEETLAAYSRGEVK